MPKTVERGCGHVQALVSAFYATNLCIYFALSIFCPYNNMKFLKHPPPETLLDNILFPESFSVKCFITVCIFFFKAPPSSTVQCRQRDLLRSPPRPLTMRPWNWGNIHIALRGIARRKNRFSEQRSCWPRLPSRQVHG